MNSQKSTPWRTLAPGQGVVLSKEERVYMQGTEYTGRYNESYTRQTYGRVASAESKVHASFAYLNAKGGVEESLTDTSKPGLFKSAMNWVQDNSWGVGGGVAGVAAGIVGVVVVGVASIPIAVVTVIAIGITGFSIGDNYQAFSRDYITGSQFAKSVAFDVGITAATLGAGKIIEVTGRGITAAFTAAAAKFADGNKAALLMKIGLGDRFGLALAGVRTVDGMAEVGVISRTATGAENMTQLARFGFRGAADVAASLGLKTAEVETTLAATYGMTGEVVLQGAKGLGGKAFAYTNSIGWSATARSLAASSGEFLLNPVSGSMSRLLTRVGEGTSPLARLAASPTVSFLANVSASMAKNAAVWGYQGYIPFTDIKMNYGGLGSVLGVEAGSTGRHILDMAVMAPFLFSGLAAREGEGFTAFFSGNTIKAAGRTSAADLVITSETRAFFQNLVSGGTTFLSAQARKLGGEVYTGLVTAVPRSFNIMADVALFNVLVSGVGGTINTLMDGAPIVVMGGLITIGNYDNFGSAVRQVSSMVSTQLFDPHMMTFSALVGVGHPVLGPLFQAIPFFGPLMKQIGQAEVFIGGRFAEGKLGRMQAFIYEEGFQEGIAQSLVLDHVFDSGSMASEVSQEMFDKRGRHISAAHSSVGFVNSHQSVFQALNRFESGSGSKADVSEALATATGMSDSQIAALWNSAETNATTPERPSNAFMAWATRNLTEPTSGFAFREGVADRLSSEILAANYGVSPEAIHGVLTEDMNEEVFNTPSARALYMESAAQLMQTNPTLAAGNPDGATFFQRAAAAGDALTATPEGAQHFGRYVRLAFAALPNTPTLDSALRSSIKTMVSSADRFPGLSTSVTLARMTAALSNLAGEKNIDSARLTTLVQPLIGALGESLTATPVNADFAANSDLVPALLAAGEMLRGQPVLEVSFAGVLAQSPALLEASRGLADSETGKTLAHHMLRGVDQMTPTLLSRTGWWTPKTWRISLNPAPLWPSWVRTLTTPDPLRWPTV
ncbi:MAG: hypothetical protein IPP68_03770 [Elusimicrobia bacterium]|nr:hypothetical protein [Elusimicrobiota bacterium]